MLSFLVIAAVAGLPDGFESARLRVRTALGEANIEFRDGHAEHAWYKAELAFEAAPKRLRLTVVNLVDTEIFSEALELRIRRDAVDVANRDYRFIRLAPGQRAHQDPWSPHAMRAGTGDAAFALPGYDNFPSVEVERFAPDDTRIRFELDHAANHPHFAYECRPVKKPKAARFGFAWDPDDPLLRREMSALRRRAGESRSYYAVYRVGADAAAPAYWKARQPAPYRATIVFTDHADQALYTRVRAVLFGDSDPARASGGFVGHKIPLTKSLFTVNDGRAPQLAPGEYMTMAKDAVARGVEFGPHTVTASRDTRDQTRAGLATFAELGATTWIDHSPLTNCEAIGNQGWNPASPYYVLDLLKARGYRLLWAHVDVAGGERNLNMLRPDEPAWRRILLFEHPRVAPGFWLFASHRLFDRFEDLAGLFSRPSLDRFVEERGVLIAHSYLDFHSPASGYNFRSWLVQRVRHYALKPEANALLAALARRRDRGDIWLATVRDFADYLAASRDVIIDVGPEGKTIVENRSASDLPQFQLVRSIDGARVDIPLKRGERLVVPSP